MIINHLMRLIRERGTNVLRVAQETGVSRSGVAGMYHGHSTRYDAATLSRLCAYFGVGVGELLEYVPDMVQEPEKDEAAEDEWIAVTAPPRLPSVSDEELGVLIAKMAAAVRNGQVFIVGEMKE